MNNDNMQNAKIEIDPRDYPTYKCDKCGNETFVPAVIFKTIPGVVVGKAGEDINEPLNVFICAKCHAIIKEDRKLLKLDDESKEEKKADDKPQLII